MLRLENVGLRYGDGPEILRDVSFALRGGDFYFLTGPSGAYRLLANSSHLPNDRRPGALMLQDEVVCPRHSRILVHGSFAQVEPVRLTNPL